MCVKIKDRVCMSTSNIQDLFQLRFLMKGMFYERQR